jgi:hypothetical protein
VEVSVGVLVRVAAVVGCRVEVGRMGVTLADGLIRGDGVKLGGFVAILVAVTG